MTAPIVEHITDLYERAIILYEYGELIAVLVEPQLSLYFYHGKLYIMKYDERYVLLAVERICEEDARRIFGGY